MENERAYLNTRYLSPIGPIETTLLSNTELDQGDSSDCSTCFHFQQEERWRLTNHTYDILIMQ